MPIRRSVTNILVMTMAAIAAIMVMAAPADASGQGIASEGGCIPGNIQNGWNLSVCIADDGVNMKPDHYVDGVGPGFWVNCHTRGRVEDVQERAYTEWYSNSCTPGWKGQNWFRDCRGLSLTGLRNHVEVRVQRQYGGPVVTEFSGYSKIGFCR